MLFTRRIYQTNKKLEDALKIWDEFIGTLPVNESIPVHAAESAGYVTAESVSAKISSPFYHASAMDGYAVRFKETLGSSETRPLRLSLGDEAVPVNTGDPLPEGFDAVIMVEEVSLEGDSIEITGAAFPYQYVRVVGEDIVQTELILPENHIIRPVDIAAMISSGNTEVRVRRRPVAAVIPTGGEIVEPGSPMKAGRIVDSNSYMVASLMSSWGGGAERTGIVPDKKEGIRDAVSAASERADFVVTIAGASAGTKDFMPNVVEEIGEILVHGVSIKPGRPVLLGRIGNRPFIGLPGYPVAAYIAFELFGRPLISRLLGIEPEEPDTLNAVISRPVPAKLGQEEFLRVKLGKVRERFVATPVGRGAGALMTLQRADGIVRIPSLSEGIAAGTDVKVSLIRSRKEIEHTVVCIGSHDNSLDLLANFLRKRYPCFSLSSAHVGSMGGIMAIKKSEAHIAGTHLLDEETGEYNIPFVKRLMKDESMKLINLVYRQQGLIVPEGNPKRIESVDDLTRDDLTFINRQAGSGTRLLTDKCLRDRGISADDIRGYNKEEYTHMGVASAVASGAADAGMGILTAAIALGLQFIPVAKERYDLLIGGGSLELPMVRALLDIISDDTGFKDSVSALGGYDVSDMGKVIYGQ